ncbi:MAG: DNA-directed RNA polymerase subunit omega [Phycisphaerae bacterium]|nr:DNA-directed RNA polymerase subunit omega [Phycisphaerae bacterium]
MIEALKSDAIVDKVGGRFKLCSLIQRRLVQLMEGARPLVDRDGRSDLEIVIEEILQDKITLEIPRDLASNLGALPATVALGAPSEPAALPSP